MKNYKELTVWQKSIDLAEEIYSITSRLPTKETYGIASQMQRAVVAIASNIAEGAKRNHRNEYIQFLGIANGSAAELETQLILTKKLYKDHKINFQKAELLTLEILKMLSALISTLRRNLPTTH